MIYETGHVTNQAPPTNLSEVSEPLCLLGDAAGQEDVCLWLFIVFLQHDLDGSVAELRVVTVLVGGHAAVTEREDLGEEGRRERERRERERRERERREEGGGREKGGRREREKKMKTCPIFQATVSCSGFSLCHIYFWGYLLEFKDGCW